MATLPIWEVDLVVDGPVAIRHHFRTTQQKGFRLDDPFYSDVSFRDMPHGLRATITARASDEKLAFEAAVFFFGQMLDALTLTVDRPMYLSLTEGESVHRRRYDVHRVVEEEEIGEAFHLAHHLSTNSPSFLRSLGWYRKGLYAEDPFDRFLALWNAMEIVASRYYRYVPTIDKERAKKGSKSQLWECFKAIWGPCEKWPIIGGDRNWIDQHYEIRNDVAHGIESVNVEKVGLVADKTVALRQVAHRFLGDWRKDLLDVDRHPPSESLLEGDGESQAN